MSAKRQKLKAKISEKAQFMGGQCAFCADFLRRYRYAGHSSGIS